MQYLDGGHQMGQDQPCGTPQSLSPQVLISWKMGKNKTGNSESHTEITKQLLTVHVQVVSLCQYVDQVLSIALLFLLPLLQQCCELCF